MRRLVLLAIIAAGFSVWSRAQVGSIPAAGGSSGNATTVNSGSVPTSAPCTGTNSSAQFISVSCGGAGGPSTGAPAAPSRFTINIGTISAAATWVVNQVTPTFVTPPSLNTTGDLNDISIGAGYTSASTVTYCVKITSTGTPDQFSWGTGGSCTSGATGVSITGTAQTLSNGFNVTFAATTGHASGTVWTTVVTPGSAVATAATSQAINLFTMSARAKAVGFSMKQSVAFTGIANENATNGLTGVLGWSGLASAYMGSCDLGQTVSNTQQCDIGGQFSTTFASHTVTLTLQSACSSGSCFLSGLTSTASVDIWATVLVLP